MGEEEDSNSLAGKVRDPVAKTLAVTYGVNSFCQAIAHASLLVMPTVESAQDQPTTRAVPVPFRSPTPVLVVAVGLKREGHRNIAGRFI